MGHVALGILILTTAIAQPTPAASETKLLVPSIRAGKMDLFLVDPGTGTTKNLTATPDGIELWPAWSADGKRIACVTWSDKEKNATEVTVMDADGSNRKRLAAPDDGGVCVCPTWSPDGGKVAYGRVFTSPARSEVRMVNSDGTNDALVLENAAFPAWSPDGSRIAFSRMDPTARTSRLCLMKPDGSDAVDLTDPMPEASGLTAAWSPDGKWIAFPAPMGNSLELHVISPDGKTRRQLTHLGAGTLHPVWLNESTLLCTHVQPQSGSAYLTVRADGSRLQIHPLTKLESAHALVRPAVAITPSKAIVEPKPVVRPVSHVEPAGLRLTPLMMFRANGRVILDTVWSPDGKSFSCFGLDGSLGIADVTPTSVRMNFETSAHPGGVTSAAWSNDGKRVYSTGMDKTLHLWSPPAKDAAVSMDTTDGNITLAAHPAGKWLACVGSGGEIVIRDPESLKPQKSFAFAETKTVGLFAVAWSKDGNTLFAAGGSGQIPVLGGAVGAFNPETGEALWRTKGTFGSVSALALSADGKKLAGACGDTFIRVWDATDGKELLCLKGHADRTTGVSWSPDGKWLASSGLDHTVRMWDAATGASISTLAGHLGPVLRVHFHPSGKSLISAGMDRVLLWKVEGE